jgi:hypothetical protein
MNRDLQRSVVLVAAVASAAVGVACQSAADHARDELARRLQQEAPLTHEEIIRLFEVIGPVIQGKAVTVRQGAITRTLDEKERLQTLGILSDPAAVYDGGVKIEGGTTWRGLKAGGTPPLSEVDATQTLWIDVKTFVPRRYDFTFSMPGFGDYSYDLMFAK